MTDSAHPRRNPLAGTEAEHPAGALNRLRTTFRWKADALDAAGLQTRVGASSVTLGGLLEHLAAVEDYTFTTKLRGESIGARWDATDRDGSNDWEFTSAAYDTPNSSPRPGKAPSNGPARGSTRALGDVVDLAVERRVRRVPRSGALVETAERTSVIAIGSPQGRVSTPRCLESRDRTLVQHGGRSRAYSSDVLRHAATREG